jgi:hypothetical protein
MAVSENKEQFYQELRQRAQEFREGLEIEAPTEQDEAKVFDDAINFVTELGIDIAESLERLATATEAQFD